MNSKNQITLPLAALATANVRPGDVLRVEVNENGALRLIRHRDAFLDALGELAGSAPGLAAATDLEELRTESEQ
ncbi:AbrB/MazE/SpoVT family DNA-binding domain-containing protein [Alloactinosynnema sp. L-07]|uniref:AbrB/MazE/SpoVT family DNA-binding domain-containing protein n=1 Tax=Alloactinosynnema sp. L-07 TaxID=1653480 RepID=UPI0012FC8231|nr:AbrB/MazE/SpoVT family DNA-binding domain-containing protein [Alloactinosynnema sp. L-07]